VADRPVVPRGPIRRHEVQLTSVFVSDISAHLRPSREKDPPEPRISPRRGRLIARADDGLSLSVSVSAAVRLRLPDQQTWDARLAATGVFVATTELSQSDAELFASTSGFFVLWPFVRTHLDLIAKIAGVSGAPPLPLLLRATPAPSGSREPRRKS
jgi:preprotein translocase subunit SecB